MPELRWNPLLGTYTMVAANRQDRPHLPRDYCPFCPGSEKVPEDYEVYVYPNDFPALHFQPEDPLALHPSFYKAKQSYGTFEVILYSPDHYKGLAQLSLEHIFKLVQVWKNRFVELSQDKKIKYIHAFENKGEEVGVTIHHPHGQLYAHPFLPLKIKTELDNCKAYYQKHKRSLFSDMNAEEKRFGKRVIFKNDHFIAYIPYFTDYPYGVFIVSKDDVGHFGEMNEQQHRDFAQILKFITAAFDQLFNKPFPYMMSIHQAPVNCEDYSDCNDYYRFHVEFYPPLRSADKIKWVASSETGAWAAANTLYVEDTAQELRQALESWRKETGL